jgi:hypothetical protein
VEVREVMSAGEEGVAYSSYGASAGRDGPIAPYLVELALAEPAALDGPALAAAAARRTGLRVEQLGKAAGAVFLVFPDLVTRFAEGDVPAQVLVIPADVPARDPEKMRRSVEPSLLQSWDWQGARAIWSTGRNYMTVNDHLAARLAPADRFRIFHGVLASVVEQVHPVAINWLPAQRLVQPQAYLAALGEDTATFDLMVNVRAFRIDGPAPSVVMDTMGMRSFDLPDLQINFTDLEPGRVAAWLKNVAYYVYEHGDVILDEHTVEGFNPDDRWPCRHEVAMIGPERVVLDVDPSPHGPARK